MVDAYNALTSTPSPEGQSISASGAGGAQSLGSVETAILATDDVYQGYGGTPTSYVTGLYNAILARAPDPTGLAYFAGLIAAGKSRQDVIAQLLSSDEAKRTEVARWYQTELGWDEPVADLKFDPGVEYWASVIEGGVSDDVVHAMILADGIAPGGNSTDFVTGLYQAALGRAPDPTGLAYFAAQVDQGVSRYNVALTVLTSDESRRTEIARFYQHGLGWSDSVADLKVNAGVEYWASLVTST
jgi:hypothetical protein